MFRLTGSLLVFAALFAGCSGDNEPPSVAAGTAHVPTTAVEPSETPEPTETPVPPPRLQRLSAGSPIAEQGSYILDTENGAVTKVASTIGHHALSPAERYLAIRNCCDTGMGVLDLVSGQFQHLDTPNPNEVIWDHLGRRLFFTVSNPVSEAGVYVINRDGTDLRRLVSQAYPSDLRQFASSELGFTAGEAGSEVARYFTIDLTSGTVRELVRTDPISLEDPRIVFGAVSNSGEWVAFREEFTAYAWNVQTQELRFLSENVTQLQWAPNRDQLLVVKYGGIASNDTAVLFDFRAGTSMPIEALGLWSQWTNDGSGIVGSGYRCDRTVSGGASGRADVLVYEVVSQRTTFVTSTPDKLEYEIAVAPTRNQAVFVTKNGGYELSRVGLNTKTVDVLVKSSLDIHIHHYAPSGPWSPDGRFVQFYVQGGHGICD